MKKINCYRGIKNTIYQSTSSWFVIFPVFVLFIIGHCIYLDLKIDGILFNDTYLYGSQVKNIFAICFVMIIFSLLYVKIVIINDELIIYRMILLFWIKPYKFKIANIQKVAILNSRIPIITISYKHDIYINAICKKTINYWGIGRKSENQFIRKLKEFGIDVQK